MARRAKGIYKRKDGRYEGRVLTGRDDFGKAVYKSVYGGTYKECKNKVQSFSVDLVAAKAEKTRKESNCKLDYLIEIFLSNKKGMVRNTTYATYLYKCQMLSKYLGDECVRDIDSLKVQRMIIDMSECYNVKTIKDVVQILKAVYNFGVDMELCKEKKFKITYPHKEEEECCEYETLTESEFKALYDFCRVNTSDEATAVFIALNTGMRIGEVCALQKCDINADKRLVSVTKSVKVYTDPDTHKYTLEIGQPKTKTSCRNIPVSEDFINVMQERFKDRSDDYFLCYGSHAANPDCMRVKYKRLLALVGIECEIPFHGLRHTFTTRMIERGVDPKTTAAFLGHSSTEMTMDVYTSCTERMKQDALEKMWGDRFEL